VDVAVRELQFEFEDELVDHHRDDRRRQVAERHRRIEAVAEFGREHALDRLLVLAHAYRGTEADAFPRHVRRARVRRHDEDDVAEIDHLAVMIGELSGVHHL